MNGFSVLLTMPYITLIMLVGHGGFGHVVLCKNKLDGRQYALKMIRLKDENLPVNDRILRYYIIMHHIHLSILTKEGKHHSEWRRRIYH